MRSPVKLAATKALATAAAAILVVAGLAVAVPGGGSTGDEAALDTLLAAAEATESVGSANVRVVGDAHTAVRLDLDRFLPEAPGFDEMIERLDEALDPERPELPEVPGSTDGGAERSTGAGGSEAPDAPAMPALPKLPEIPEPDCEGIPEDRCGELRRQLEDARERLERSLDQRRERPAFDGFERPDGPDGFEGLEGLEGLDPEALREQIREQMLEEIEARRGEVRNRMREHLADAQARFEEQLGEIPDEFRCDYRFEGSGTMSIPGTVEIGGDAEVSCDPDFIDGSGRFDTVITHDVTFRDNGDGTFTAAPRGGIGSVVADGESIAELLRKAEHADDEGTEQLDGVTVRHLSFSTDEGPATLGVDVWIGTEDHVVRKVVTRSSGEIDRDGVHVEFAAEHTVLVTDVQLDAPADGIEIPDFEDVVPAHPAAGMLDDLTNPFGESVPSPFFGSEVTSS